MAVRVNAGKPDEVTLRLVVESEEFGREYFDDFDTQAELLAGLDRLLGEAVKGTTVDSVARLVAVAVVPRCDYGDESGYGYGLSAEGE